MEYRSTNAGQHISNDIVAGVGSSHGVQISGGSTGGVVQTVADDTSAALTLLAKGAGPVIIGNSSQAITLGNGSTLVTIGTTGGQVRMGGSTAPFYGMIRMEDTAGATPASFNDTDAGRVYESTHTFTGVTSSHFIVAQSNNLPAGVVIGGARAASTAGQVHVVMVKGSTAAVAGTTCTITILAFRF